MQIDFGRLTDKLVDGWERISSDHTDRTGESAARVASSLANGVDVEVIALQANLNSKRNNPSDPQTFTDAEIVGVAKWHLANRTRSAFTKEQSGDLIRNQRAADAEAQDGEPA